MAPRASQTDAATPPAPSSGPPSSGPPSSGPPSSGTPSVSRARAVSAPAGFEATAPVTIAHRLQYGAVRVLVAALRLLGWRGVGWVGAWLGRVAYRPVGIRREVVETNIARAFPERPHTEVMRIARAAYESLGRTSLETAVLAGSSPERVLSLVPECEGFHLIEEAHALGQGIMVATGHLGNWELGGAYLAARGIPTAAITRRMQNPLFDRYLRATRNSLACEVIHDAVAVRQVPRALKAGTLVAFLCDQDGLGLASTFVPYFGRPARTPRGPAVFALRLGVPLLFAACLRRPDGRYRMVVDTIPFTASGDRQQDVDTIVAAYTKRLEDEVRRVPEQYFWHHRRWKRQPPPPQ